MAENNEIKVKSLQKALEILNLFTEKPVLGVTEVSEYFGLYKSTVHNILSTLKAMEYLEQDEETGKYRLGIQIFNLSKALGDTYSITKIAAAHVKLPLQEPPFLCRIRLCPVPLHIPGSSQPVCSAYSWHCLQPLRVLTLS